MSRRRAAEKVSVRADPKFGDLVVSKLVNNVMRDGKKARAESIVYSALAKVESELSKKPLDVLHESLDKIRPRVEVRSRRVGGATYQVPVEVPHGRGQALAIRWLLSAARARSEKGMQFGLSAELVDAFRDRGAAIKKRSDVHRMAEANRAFSHYRW